MNASGDEMVWFDKGTALAVARVVGNDVYLDEFDLYPRTSS